MPLTELEERALERAQEVIQGVSFGTAYNTLKTALLAALPPENTEIILNEYRATIYREEQKLTDAMLWVSAVLKENEK